MAAAVAELTGLPISKAVDLFEQHGSVEAAVAAHFDGTATGPPASAQNSESQAAAPLPPTNDVEGILGKARVAAETATPGGIGRQLGSSPGISGGPERQRKIDVVFFRDGVAFLELPAAPSRQHRKTGMHSLGRRPTLPPELDGLEDHRLIVSLPASNPEYDHTIRLLNDSKVPPALINAEVDNRDTAFSLVLRDARARSISTITAFAGNDPEAAAQTFVGTGRSLGGTAAASSPEGGSPSSTQRDGSRHVTSVAAAAAVAVAAAVFAGVDVKVASLVVAFIGGGALWTRGGLANIGQTDAVPGLTVDPEKPITTVKVRLAPMAEAVASLQKSQTVSITLNSDVHTVADLYREVRRRSDVVSFSLVSSFPPKPLGMDDKTTIGAAGLQGALVNQRAL
eukprot:m.86991 g.86991  ORF g.86991 m.86991 type:complete len:397 (-) comp11510_c0_seq1:122-1312(-)